MPSSKQDGFELGFVDSELTMIKDLGDNPGSFSYARKQRKEVMLNGKTESSDSGRV